MIVALHNFSVMVKKAGREYSKGYKKYMAFHLIFISLNIFVGILVAVAAYPFQDTDTLAQIYLISVLTWSVIRKSSEFSILLLLD